MMKLLPVMGVVMIVAFGLLYLRMQQGQHSEQLPTTDADTKVTKGDSVTTAQEIEIITPRADMAML
jgi:preprotein translocase subunit YajC